MPVETKIALPALKNRQYTANHERLAYQIGEREDQLLSALTQLSELRAASEWISVEDRLPDSIFNVIVWIPNQSPRGGYYDLASYGEWLCEDEDCRPGDPNYVADNDEGNRRGFGWHREEETHGGPYDYVTIDLNSKVTHWKTLPLQPSPASAGKGE